MIEVFLFFLTFGCMHIIFKSVALDTLEFLKLLGHATSVKSYFMFQVLTLDDLILFIYSKISISSKNIYIQFCLWA